MEIDQAVINMYEELMSNSMIQISSTAPVEPNLSNNVQHNVDVNEDNENNEQDETTDDIVDITNTETEDDIVDITNTETTDDIVDITNTETTDDIVDITDTETTENVVKIINTQTNNQPNLLKIDQINTDINFSWKMRAIIIYKHPKRAYNNANGAGEISKWDLVDDTGSINLIAFNLNSNVMSNKLIEGKSFEFDGLSIRTVDEIYKDLPHPFQLMVTHRTNVREISMPLNYQLTYNFIHLNQIEDLPLNSIIDVDVKVLRDYGITTGITNDFSWSRRDLHVAEDGVQIKLTLWNEQAKNVPTSMINKRIKLKNVKISWFSGSRTLVTLSNTRLSVI